MNKTSRFVIAAAAGLVLTAPASRADRMENAAFTLGALGFDLRGQHNPLSDGTELLITNDFTDQTLDFGPWALTLDGPISLQLSTGGRLLSQIDISLNTALNRDANEVPLSYEVNVDVGAQSRQVTGTLLLDADFSHKGLGFYDINLQVSSRQDVVHDGVFRTGDEQSDFDVGPIDISGNVFADLLAVITDPFFQATGRPNFFESFSGRAQLQALFDADAAQALRRLAETGELGPDLIGGFDRFESLSLRLIDPAAPNAFRPAPSGAVVPEPTVVLLMLLGIPAVLRRRR